MIFFIKLSNYATRSGSFVGKIYENHLPDCMQPWNIDATFEGYTPRWMRDIRKSQNKRQLNKSSLALPALSEPLLTRVIYEGGLRYLVIRTLRAALIASSRWTAEFKSLYCWFCVWFWMRCWLTEWTGRCHTDDRDAASGNAPTFNRTLRYVRDSTMHHTTT